MKSRIRLVIALLGVVCRALSPERPMQVSISRVDTTPTGAHGTKAFVLGLLVGSFATLVTNGDLRLISGSYRAAIRLELVRADFRLCRGLGSAVNWGHIPVLRLSHVGSSFEAPYKTAERVGCYRNQLVRDSCISNGRQRPRNRDFDCCTRRNLGCNFACCFLSAVLQIIANWITKLLYRNLS